MHLDGISFITTLPAAITESSPMLGYHASSFFVFFCTDWKSYCFHIHILSKCLIINIKYDNNIISQ